MKKITTVAVAVFLVLSAIIGATGSVVATTSTTDCSTVDSLFGDCDGRTLSEDFATASAFVDGALQRFAYNIKASSPGVDGKSADAIASNLTDEYNSHNDTYETYANKHISASTDRNVVEITIQTEDGAEATRYLVADVTDGNYTNSRMVNSTDKTVDDYVVLEGKASQDVVSILTDYRTTHVASGEKPPLSYGARLKGHYGDEIETSLVVM